MLRLNLLVLTCEQIMRINIKLPYVQCALDYNTMHLLSTQYAINLRSSTADYNALRSQNVCIEQTPSDYRRPLSRADGREVGEEVGGARGRCASERGAGGAPSFSRYDSSEISSRAALAPLKDPRRTSPTCSLKRY